jgi:hypothetical protein
MKTFLFIILTFVGLTSFVSGLLMMSVPDGSILNLPISILKNTPFKDFKLPGLILFVFVGCVSMVAVFYNMVLSVKRFNWAIVSGIMIFIWMFLQFLFLKDYLLIELIYGICGVFIITISIHLKGKSLL